MAANTDTLGSGPQIIKDDDKQLAACRKMRNWLLSELIDCRQENERLANQNAELRMALMVAELPLPPSVQQQETVKEYSDEC